MLIVDNDTLCMIFMSVYAPLHSIFPSAYCRQQTKRMGNILVPLSQRVACHALLEPEAHIEVMGVA